jgi:phage shock protein A
MVSDVIRQLRRMWKYFAAKLGSDFESNADPKIQLEQAITEANDQHRRLKEQAANVVANQKQAELKLNRSMDELEKANAMTRQSLVMAADAEKAGDAKRAADLTKSAETLATRLVQLEADVAEQKSFVLEASQAADQAKSAVQQNSAALQAKLAERSKLLSQLDQAKMQEQLTKAMGSLQESVGQDTPSFDEVRNKIEQRYAKAKSMNEINSAGVETQMLEIEQATRSASAQARLSELRSELGLNPTAAPETAAAPTGAVAPSAEGGTA